jgi:hypothetical protein
MNAIKQLTETFISQITHVVEVGIRNAALSALGAGKGYDYSKLPRGLPKTLKPGLFDRKPRRKGTVQLCPSPGCKNRAAPVFGMVCSKHKDLPKADIKKYREARRAKKAGK